eukprot:TRINITY_DN4160_c0_g1_i4.p1 TRINITY_DN4160_c0_g1~~TRINITY_DN4160_c0_g1_i4.p1  ORF type:complete len:199 (+),score=23.10 TRINITY_DN4160_c0_g1_i4:928-1524(+)
MGAQRAVMNLFFKAAGTKRWTCTTAEVNCFLLSSQVKSCTRRASTRTVSCFSFAGRSAAGARCGLTRRAAAGAPELLLQWRSAQKWVFGGMWETAGEHLLSGGESWQQGARRGLSEELGVVIPDPEQPGNEAALAAVGWRQLTATHLSCFTAFHPKLPPDIELRPDGKATASNRDAIDQRNSTYLACRCCSAAPCFGL